MRAKYTIYAVSLFLTSAAATCYDPSPAFPVPSWSNGAVTLAPTFLDIESRLKELVANEKYDTASFSVELTSTTATLWSSHHTARKRNTTRPGVDIVDGQSQYRIASITKVFTVLGLLYQHTAGNLSLDSPISDYIPELDPSSNSSGDLPFKDITLRILASQLSGVPRDFAQGDVFSEVDDPTQFGLPPPSKEDSWPQCDEYSNYWPPCNATDLLDYLNKAHPIFAPNQQSTYSNLAFELLGLALEKATALNYTTYMTQAVFTPLNLSYTTLTTPSDAHAVLPWGNHYWDVNEGVQNPTGGIYSSSTDLSKFLRYVLTHYNALATGVNWLLPASWSGGMGSFTGMPWEIFRTEHLLEQNRRPVTFVTKSGGLPGYVSRISLMPEYGLGLTILVAGAGSAGNLLDEVQELVSVTIIRAAEEAIWKSIEQTHTGTFVSTNADLNSSIVLTASPSTGLILQNFISNATDVLETAIFRSWVDHTRRWRVQLVPTLLYKNETEQKGEIWRLQPAYQREKGVARGVWDEFCVTDVDPRMYAGWPINEVVFWHEEDVVELPAWKVRMSRVHGEKETEVDGLVVQD